MNRAAKRAIKFKRTTFVPKGIGFDVNKKMLATPSLNLQSILAFKHTRRKRK